MGRKRNWNRQGKKQVATIGMDKKCAFTLVLSISTSGELLPMQTIFFGQTEASCPNKGAHCYAEAEKRGFKFEPSHSTTYWSTQAMMWSLMNDIIVTYFNKKKDGLGLPSKQCSLWMIDCWSVHKSKEFCDWMKKTHPTIIISYLLHTGWMHWSLAISQCQNLTCTQVKHETISS
jgi:hypothetical protein